MIAARKAVPAETSVRGRARVRPATRVKTVIRRRYVSLGRLALLFVVPFVLLMGYVAMTANLTSLGYKLARAGAERESLQADIARMDDRIAQLQSPERLAAMAARLGMRDPHRYAVVHLPDPVAPNAPHRIALLSTVTDWLKLP